MLAAYGQEDLSLLYFFSPSCSHCTAVAPVVKELSKEFPIQGLVYGKGNPEPMPFEVRKGDKETSKRYGIQGVPNLVVLNKGSVKTIFRGEHEIRDAGVMLSAFRKGALTVSEVTAKGPQQDITITGWVLNKGDYFKNTKFMLTDRRMDIQVKPWLPLEVARSPLRKTRPRLMSDVINKPVALRGNFVKKEEGLEFVVTEELSIGVR